MRTHEATNGQHVDSDDEIEPRASAGSRQPATLTAEEIDTRLKEREEEDGLMLRSIDDRLMALDSERDRLIAARVKIVGVATVHVAAPAPKALPLQAGAAPVAMTLRMQILRYLAGGQKATTEDIASAVGRGEEVIPVRQSLYDMATKPQTIKRTGRGIWEITSKGRAALDVDGGAK